MKREKELVLLHEEELRILQEISNICTDNNIRFYMLGGTFLGAIRHKGFIPWDDDADIGLPRKDYDKFVDICKNKLNDDFEIFTYEDEQSGYNYVCKIQSKKLKIIENSCKEAKEYGAWVDIFPMDGMPNNKLKFYIHKARLKVHRAFWKFSDNGNNIGRDKKSRSIIDNIVIKLGILLNIGKLFDKKKEMLKINKILKKYDYDKCNYIVNYFGAYRYKEMFQREIFDKKNMYQFENLMLPASENYDFYLRQLYGDYMTPPKDSSKNKHDVKLKNSN